MEARKDLENMIEPRDMIDLQVKSLFESLLQGCGRKGEIKIDHQKQTLEVKVSSMNDPHVEDIMPTGDCSYAIVCLIMALWEAIKPPFYILDGFYFSADMMNHQRIIEPSPTEDRLPVYLPHRTTRIRHSVPWGCYNTQKSSSSSRDSDPYRT
ncbi:structural maintenance of chromosomes protein 6-like [Zootermopsis nevadensis]|uniref:structural maintenance of chromosomes protein 6-like n=1 Tax=Zootermopsis nevadensis TaxID=136037 RepID=UPI000B8E6F95|nr:structural maintenance of chromosomes protein 6-like [Zootermopsis nevadensis]